MSVTITLELLINVSDGYLQSRQICQLNRRVILEVNDSALTPSIQDVVVLGV
ncbi:MAG: hypothetical protein AB8B92_05510 [Gammaproteobacteria bacterium]